MKSTSYYFAMGLLSTTFLAPVAALAQESGNGEQPDAGGSQANDVIEEVLVRGEYIPEPKRDSSQVSSFITREDFVRTGDDDVSASLTRMTGVKLNRGKFVFVRGLGERFSSVVLNGIELPSPEPLRRVAPLDIFPTEVLEGLSVQKTFSPQYNADFGGGLINLETRAIPDEPSMSFSAEVGIDTQTTFRNAAKVEGGELDFLGINDGIRDLSPELKSAFLSGKEINSTNFTDAELQAIGRSIPNAELSVLFEGDAPVNTEFNGTIARPFELFGADAGIILNGNFTSDWETKRGKRQTGIPIDVFAEEFSLEVTDDLDLLGSQLDTRWSGLATFGLDWGDHVLRFTNLYIKSTTKENRILSGDNADGRTVRRDFIEWFDRELFTTQVAGDHFLFSDTLEVKWNFGYSDASRDEPFTKEFGFIENNQGNLIFDNIGGEQDLIRFSTIADEVLAGGIEGRFNFSLSGAIDGTFYAGWDGSETDRDAARRELSFQSTSTLPNDLLGQRIDFIFADQNINPNRFEIEERTPTQFDPNYIGSLIINGYFFGSEINLGDFVNIDAGVRIEDGEQIVDTFSPIRENPFVETVIDGTDVLPTVAVNWTFADNMQLRGAFSQTIGRPQFRELAISEFINVETDRTFIGNPFLVNPELDNFDLRWEWYFAREQFLTVGLFYKNIDNPIEEFVTQSGGGGDTVRTSFQQIPQARLKGVEVELNRRFTLDDEFPIFGDFFKNKEFLIATNYTFTDSEIVVEEGDEVIRSQFGSGTGGIPAPQRIALAAIDNLEDGRPLQGQADHIFNVQIGYEDFRARSQFTILYNFTSERIRELGSQFGTRNLPPVLARDPASLDIRYVKGFTVFGQDMSMAISARNLLGDDFRAVQIGADGNKIEVDTFEVGRSISLSFTANF